MNQIERQKKKRRIINLILVAIAVVILAGVVLVDYVSNLNSDATLTVKQAEKQIEDMLQKDLQMKSTVCTQYMVSSTVVHVTDIRNGGDRSYIATVEYQTLDAKSVYDAHKAELFALVWNFYKGHGDGGTKAYTNATDILIAYEDTVLSWLETEAPRKTGTVEIKFYDVRADQMRIYMSDEVVNTLLGGYLDIRNDIQDTMEIEVDGETVSVKSDNTLRKGIMPIFELRNYDTSKPDTSSPLQQWWNGMKADFHKNFIEENRWLYLLEGVGNTLALTGLSLLLGILLGLVTAVVRVVHEKTGKIYYLDKISKLYVSIIRGTPLMVQLLIIYFVLLLPIGIEKFPAAVLCFGLNSGAYVSEIIRGGIMSVDPGQTEAGRSLGFGFAPTMIHIVMPQAFKAVLPALCNEFISLLKETSVAFYIGVADLTRGGIKIRSITYSNFMPLIAVALIYLILVLILTKLVGLLERRLRKSDR